MYGRRPDYLSGIEDMLGEGLRRIEETQARNREDMAGIHRQAYDMRQKLMEAEARSVELMNASRARMADLKRYGGGGRMHGLLGAMTGQAAAFRSEVRPGHRDEQRLEAKIDTLLATMDKVLAALGRR